MESIRKRTVGIALLITGIFSWAWGTQINQYSDITKIIFIPKDSLALKKRRNSGGILLASIGLIIIATSKPTND